MVMIEKLWGGTLTVNCTTATIEFTWAFATIDQGIWPQAKGERTCVNELPSNRIF
jgi:hypothetical protein